MRILLIRFSSLGDVVMVTALAAAIKKQLPDSDISVLTKEEYTEVFAGSKDISSVIPLKQDKKSFLDLCALGESLEKKFDLILDLHANPRSFIVTVLASTKTIRYKKHMLKRRLLVLYSFFRGAFNFLPDLFGGCADNVIGNYFAAARSLGIKYESDGPVIYVKKPVAKERIAGIACGARYFTKRWPEENYARLIKELSVQGFGVTLFGGKEDVPAAERIAALSGVSVRNLAGETGILELASEMSRCAFVIANDSAPMHIAAASGTPVIALFCGTSPQFGFAPAYGRNTVLSAEAYCKPCGIHGQKLCWTGGFKCAEKLTVQSILEVVTDKYAKGSRND